MNKLFSLLQVIFIVYLIVFYGSVYADDYEYEDVRVSRYGYMAPNATPEQLDPLAVVVKVSFNSHITTVGEALDHLLLRSGYRMAALKASDPNMQILISRDLPEVHRKLGPITLTNALKTLSGPAWELVVDPVNRLISFDLIPEYRTPLIVGSAAMPNNTLVAEVSAKGE